MPARVSVLDNGFTFGDAVYETLRTYNGQPFLFDRHMRRLRKSSGMIALSIPTLARVLVTAGEASNVPLFVAWKLCVERPHLAYAMIAAYKAGVPGNGKPFPDGSKKFAGPIGQ